MGRYSVLEQHPAGKKAPYMAIFQLIIALQIPGECTIINKDRRQIDADRTLGFCRERADDVLKRTH